MLICKIINQSKNLQPIRYTVGDHSRIDKFLKII
jgi:hypothetical protein